MGSSEQDYIQIEKVALAFLYRLYFEVEMDNCPLANIFDRDLSYALHRIQALMVKLQKNDFFGYLCTL